MGNKHAAIVIIVCVIVIISFVIIFQYKIMQPSFADYRFCEDMGYNYDVDINGNYLSYRNQDYGTVKCYECYAKSCDRETFNVTHDWRGKLIKKDANVSNDEVDNG